MVRRRFLAHSIAFIVLVAGLTLTAQAGTIVDVAEVTTTAGVAVGAGIVGTPVAGFAVAGVGSVAEVGVAFFRGWYGFGDPAPPPPDTVNFAQMANPSLNIVPYSADPTASAALNQASLNFDQEMSIVVQNIIGAIQSTARLEGALLVGTPTDVANQRMWLAQFENQSLQALHTAAPYLSTYNTLLQSGFPAYFNLSLTGSEITAFRNQEAAGTFAPSEQTVIGAWMLNSYDLNSVISPQIGALSDTTIASFTPMTVGQAFSDLEGFLSTASIIPEPTSIIPLGVGCLGVLGGAWVRSRWAALPGKRTGT
jgi:hypothetical protein